MMPQKFTRFALLTLLAVTGACDDDDPTEPEQQTAQLRIVNAAEIADVQVRRVGTTTPLAQDLDFRGVTQTCAEVPTGEHAFIFSEAGVELATTAATFEEGGRYTAFLVASGGQRRAFIVSDNETASAGNNALRLVNATSTAGDVYVTPPGTAPAAGFLAAGNASPLATSNLAPGYVHRSTDHTQVRLFNTGTTTNPRADIALTGLPTSRLMSVVFTNAAPTAFLVTPCP
jgi:hypothetical protein